jgi:hypothetical protein
LINLKGKDSIASVAKVPISEENGNGEVIEGEELEHSEE